MTSHLLRRLLPVGLLATTALLTTPTPISAASVVALPAPASPYVQTCGSRLCLRDKTFPFYGASVLAAPGDAAGAVAQAQAARLNLVRVVDFLQNDGAVATAPYDEARWQRVDRVIATARRAGLKVELDLSTYRNLLLAHHVNAYAVDWAPFVRFVTGRVNSVTGTVYAEDPTIALVAFAGEVNPPGSPDNPVAYTSAQITGFFARTLAQWKARDPHHLLTTGGLLHLDVDAGIDWRSIARLPVVDVPAIHVYSTADLTRTMPAFAAFARSLGKPWITEEFGVERSLGDAQRAAWYGTVYAAQADYRSAGAAFWNLGEQTTNPTYDVNSSTPLVLATVRSHRPAALPRHLWYWLSRLRR